MDETPDYMKVFSTLKIVTMRVKYGEKKEKSLNINEMITTCDICGKTIVGVENFINAVDKVVCSEECEQKAICDYFIKNSLTIDEICGNVNPYNNELFKRKDK